MMDKLLSPFSYPFLGEEKLGSINPKICELSYINHIPMGEGWDSLVDLSVIGELIAVLG